MHSKHECKATSRASLNTVAGTYMDTNMYYICVIGNTIMATNMDCIYLSFAGVNINTEWDKYKTMCNTHWGSIRQRAPSLCRVQCKWALFNSI